MKSRKKLNLKDALKIAEAITLGSLTGCAGSYNQSCSQDFNKPTCQRKVNHFESGYYLVPVFNDYRTQESNMGELRVLAGIFAGTIDVVVTKYDNGYKILANGMYSQAEHPEAMRKVLELADVNPKDGIITNKEVRN